MVVPRAVVPVLGLLCLAAAAAAQDPATDKPSPPRELYSDTTAVSPSAAPIPPAALTTPVRLDLTPGAEQIPPTDATPPAGRPPSLTLPPTARAGDHAFSLWARYNRVEGPAVFASVSRALERKSFLPAYRLQFGYAFGAERSQYRIGFEQPVAVRNKLTLGAEGFRSFLPFTYADEALSAEENSASAFFFHRDYWDLYEAEGMRGFLGVHPSPFLHLRLGMVAQDEAALRNHVDWSVFNQKADFPVNAPVPEGTYRGFEASLAFDTRPRDTEGLLRDRGGWSSLEHWHRVSWERGDGGLGGDFDLWRVTADLRNYFRLTPGQALSTRILAGTGDARDGVLPAARRYEVGGLGTLRGHLYRSLAGDNVALAGAQYAFAVGRRGWLLFFADAGTAWDSGSLFDQRIPIDVGTGFRIGDSGPTLLLARTLTERDAETRIEFRFMESY